MSTVCQVLTQKVLHTSGAPYTGQGGDLMQEMASCK